MATGMRSHGRAMEPEEVISFVSARSPWSPVSATSADYWRRGSAIRVRADGRWELDPDHEALRSARQAVIDRIEARRISALRHGDPAVIAANRERFEREREANPEDLGRMRRVLIHAFPAGKPQALVLVDVAERSLDTFVGDEIAHAVEKLAAYDLIASIDVRTRLRTLRFDPGVVAWVSWDLRREHERSTDAGGRSRSQPVCWCRARAASVARSATKRRCGSTWPPAN